MTDKDAMDRDELRELFRARIAELTARPPLEKVHSLLSVYLNDADGLDEVKAELRSAARRNTFFLRQDLVALETILAEPQKPFTLLQLVEGTANWGIDDPTDEGAARFLQNIARMLRDVIEEAEQRK